MPAEYRCRLPSRAPWPRPASTVRAAVAARTDRAAVWTGAQILKILSSYEICRSFEKAAGQIWLRRYRMRGERPWLKLYHSGPAMPCPKMRHSIKSNGKRQQFAHSGRKRNPNLRLVSCVRASGCWRGDAVLSHDRSGQNFLDIDLGREIARLKIE